MFGPKAIGGPRKTSRENYCGYFCGSEETVVNKNFSELLLRFEAIEVEQICKVKKMSTYNWHCATLESGYGASARQNGPDRSEKK